VGRILVIIGLVAAFALIAGSTSAQADPTGNETCGGHAWPNSHQYVDNDQWLMDMQWACGTDKIFSMEIQHTLNGGNTVFDILEVSHRSPSGCNIQCNDFWYLDGLCPVTGSYRARTNWSGGSLVTAWVGAGIICTQNKQQFP
jgi:hypothetical protein